MSSSRPVVHRRPRPVIANAPYRYPGGTSRPRNIIVLALLFVMVLGAIVAASGLYWALHRPQGASSRPVSFHVGTGDSVITIASRLQARGLVSNALLFRLDARLHDLGGKLKVGDYRLRPDMSIDQEVTALTIYRADTIPVTIPEGFRMEQTASALTRHGINGQTFLGEARHPGHLHLSILKDKPAGASLEGYLFPNTYNVPPHFSGRAFAQYMVQTLDKKFTPAMRSAAAAEHLSIYRVLTLASIVEREARVPDERPKIASVYLNRMRIGMPLQADPTVQYSIGTRQNWWPILTLDQLRVANPYNTYVNKGLPPGPIASPGLSSIRAVLHPASTQFLYFVAKGHGRHAFARTYAEQLQNQQKYASAAP